MEHNQTIGCEYMVKWILIKMKGVQNITLLFLFLIFPDILTKMFSIEKNNAFTKTVQHWFGSTWESSYTATGSHMTLCHVTEELEMQHGIWSLFRFHSQVSELSPARILSSLLTFNTLSISFNSSLLMSSWNNKHNKLLRPL